MEICGTTRINFDTKHPWRYHLVCAIKLVCHAGFFAISVVKGEVMEPESWKRSLMTLGLASSVPEVDGEFALFGEEGERAEGWVGFGKFGDVASVLKAGKRSRCCINSGVR